MWQLALTRYFTMLQAAGRSSNTIRLHRHYLTQLVNVHDDPWLVGPEDLLAMLARPSWGSETRKSARTVYRGFYTWAVMAGMMATSPAANLPTVRVGAGTPRPAPEVIFHAVLTNQCPRIVFMGMLAGFCGLRAGEIARVCSPDFDAVSRMLVVHGKGDKERVIPIVHAELALRLAGMDGWAFPGKTDGHLSPGHVTKLLSGAMPPGWTAHTLRHRAGTKAYQGTHDVLAVSRMLGHARTETTQRYVQMDDGALVAAMTAAAA